MCKCTSWMRLLAQARNPYTRWWLWIPGSRFARPGMTTSGASRNKPPLTGIETQINPLVTRRRFHGTLFVVVADRCPVSHSGLDLRVRRFALEYDAAKKRPRSVAAFRVDGARIERARMGASSASRVFQRPFWLLQGTPQRER